MNSSEFEKRKRNIVDYFGNKKKFGENEFGEMKYYKGKRNLKELRFVLDLVFGSEYQVISEDYFMNNDEKIIGGSITCQMYVDADFNGFNQGSHGADIFTKFTLVETAYFCNQSQTLDGLEY